MVRKLICSLIIFSNIYSKDKWKKDIADLNMSFQDFTIESPPEWIIQYEFKIKEAFANSNGYARANSLLGLIKYLKMKANYKTSFLKIHDISSEYKVFQIIAYNNELKNDDFQILFEKLQVLYDIDNSSETILTIYPKYFIKYNDFLLTGTRSIKLRGKNLFIHGLTLTGPFDLIGTINKINANLEEKNFLTENISFSFLEDAVGSIEKIESQDISSNFKLLNLTIKKDCNVLELKDAVLDVEKQIINLSFFQILRADNVQIISNHGYLDLNTFQLYFEDIDIFIENEKFSYIAKGCIDLKNHKLYLYDGEINV